MDFGEFLAFRQFVTPLAIQVIFWLGVLGVVVTGLAEMTRGFGGFVLGLFTIVIGVVMVRIYCELLILLFRIYDELVALRTGRSAGGDVGFPVTPASSITHPTVTAAPMTPIPVEPSTGI